MTTSDVSESLLPQFRQPPRARLRRCLEAEPASRREQRRDRRFIWIYDRLPAFVSYLYPGEYTRRKTPTKYDLKSMDYANWMVDGLAITSVSMAQQQRIATGRMSAHFGQYARLCRMRAEFRLHTMPYSANLDSRLREVSMCQSQAVGATIARNSLSLLAGGIVMAGDDNDDKSNDSSPETADQKPVKPVPFFATIHRDHYEPGEIEEINRKLLEQHNQDSNANPGDTDKGE